MSTEKDVVTAIDNGGPAFPGEKNTRFGQQNDCNEGMSLRDYFAGQVLAAFTTDALNVGRAVPSDLIAESCYALADAMLKARTALQERSNG